ncbi:probable cytochrome b561 and DOMON domain-containing protein at C-terminar half [Coccomyxa sp. Obi]|nr:probable cytochrome b561 and DOMON domain-containing protein at C-terminar half [Coccomyxa sp. Obi]
MERIQREDRQQELELEYYGANGEKARVVLPEGITWDSVHTLQLRCPWQSGAKAWAEVPRGSDHVEGTAAQRRLLQSGGGAPALLSSYPGQDSASVSHNQGSGDGQPQPLFPPPPGPPRTSVDADQQRLQFSPSAEEAGFSAVDVSAGPSVTVVDNSPGLPSLGAYPGAPADLTLTTPPAFPEFSSPETTTTASSTSPGQGTPAVPATSPGADAPAAGPSLVTAAAAVPAAAPQASPVPTTVAIASPPAQAAAGPPVAAVTPPVAAVAAVPPPPATPVPTPLPTQATASLTPAAAPAAANSQAANPVGSIVQPPVPASPTQAIAAPTAVPSDADQVAAALAQLPPGALAPAIGQNLSALAAAAGQDLNNVGGQNLTALGGANVGELAGSVLGGGNALAPAPAPTATQLINSVVPPSAALPVPGQTPAGEAAAPLYAPALAASPVQAPAADLSDAAAAAAALQALTNLANPPSQSTDAALAAALAAAATPSTAVSQPAAAPVPSAPVAAPNSAAAAPGLSGAVSMTPAAQPTVAPVAAPVAASQSTSAAEQDLGSEAAGAPTQAQADYNAALAQALAAASPPPPAGAPASGQGDYDAALAAALAAANAAPPAAAPAPAALPPAAAAPVSDLASAPVLSTTDAAAAAAAALVAAGFAPATEQQALLAAIAGLLVHAPAPSPAAAPEAASGTVPASVALAPSFYDNIGGGSGGLTASPTSAPALAPGSSGMMPSSLALGPSIYNSVVGGGGQTASPASTPAAAPGSSSSGAPAPAPIATAPSFAPGTSPSDEDLANAAIAALYSPPPAAAPQLAPAPVPAPSAAFPPTPAAAPAPAPARDFLVASSSLPEAPAAAPAQQPLPYAPPPLGNVTLTFQPPAAPAQDLGAFPGESEAPPAEQTLAPAPLAAAGPAAGLAAPAPAPELSIPETLGGGARRPTRPGAQAAGPAPQLAPAPSVTSGGVPAPAPASSGVPAAAPEAAAAGPTPAAAPGQTPTLGPAEAPLLAPAPGLVAPSAGPASAPVAAPGFAPAPGAAPESSVMLAPAPGPAGQPVVNLALTLNGPGVTNLSPAGRAAIQQALAKQLNLAPEQITVLGVRPSGSIPTRRRTLLQQPAQTDQSSVVDVQIRPAPDQTAGVLAAISQNDFPTAIKDQLTSAGLPVQSAGVAAVSHSFAPTPPPAPQPTPAPKGGTTDPALLTWNAKMIKIHGWLMFSAFVIFLPFAIMTAFAFKDWQPYWFYIHISAVVLALVAAAAGLVVGFTLIITEFRQTVHKWAGLAIVAGLLLQVLSAFLVRPPPDSRFRKYWNTAHYWWGRILLVVALLNFFFGIWLVHSSPLYYIVPAAILIFWCLAGFVKELVSWMRMGPRAHRDNGTAESLRMDYHLRGNGNGSRKPIQELYSSPLPGNSGASLHTRPSYLGGGNPAYGSPHSGGSGIQMSSAVRWEWVWDSGGASGGGEGGIRGGAGVPKSAFAAAGQNGADWDDEEGESVRNGGGTSSSNLPRPPLHPLPSHGSFTAQLPPRPSELLKEGKVGAGEQIIARRRNRRLVPEGVPLNSRLSGAYSGNLDASIGKRAAEAYKPRPRPSKLLSTPPEEMFGDEDEDYSPPPLRSRPAAPAVTSNGAGQGNGAEVSPPDSNRSTDENDLPPAVKARINSYYK